MTTLQKFKKLLQIAIEHGWDAPNIGMFNWLKHNGNDSNFQVEKLHLLCDIHNSRGPFAVPINDIVLDWDDTSISFLSALCNALKVKIEVVHEKMPFFTRQEWVNKPNTERLDFLFTEFSLLLN